MSSSTPEISPREPYIGSCHCGRIKYVAFISMPPALALVKDDQPPLSQEEKMARVRFYKCNCSTCHKMGLFHLRVADKANDFYVFSPLTLPADENDTSGDVRTYLCFDRMLNFYFCKACGVRCFLTWGKVVEDTLDLEAEGVRLPDAWKEDLKPNLSADGKKVKVLRLDPQESSKGWRVQYLSLNALTIEDEQPATKDGRGLNLPEVVDKKWLEYLDCRYEKGEARSSYPHEGGCW